MTAEDTSRGVTVGRSRGRLERGVVRDAEARALEQFLSATESFLTMLVGFLTDEIGTDGRELEYWSVRAGNFSVEVEKGRCTLRNVGGRNVVDLDLRSGSGDGRLSWNDANRVAEAFRTQLPAVDPRAEPDDRLAEFGRSLGDDLAVPPTPDQLELLRAAWWWGA